MVGPQRQWSEGAGGVGCMRQQWGMEVGVEVGVWRSGVELGR